MAHRRGKPRARPSGRHPPRAKRRTNKTRARRSERRRADGGLSARERGEWCGASIYLPTDARAVSSGDEDAPPPREEGRGPQRPSRLRREETATHGRTPPPRAPRSRLWLASLSFFLSLFLGFRQKSPMKYVRHRVNLGLLFVSCPPHRRVWAHPRGSQRERGEE